MFLIISTSNNNLQNNSDFFWGSKYLPAIKPYLPESIIDIIGITEGIIYFNKSELKELNAFRFKITSSALTANYFKVKYSITNQTEFKSLQIRDALKKYLNKNSVLDLPFCCAVDESEFLQLLGNNSLQSEIENLQLNNNWSEIYKLLEKHQPLEQNKIWNDPEILNKFSFAVAKLSECSENLKKKFPDKEKRKQFIDEKRKFRKLCIKLRLRCIELQPNNASFLSNLAYTYYQSATELSAPNGRRDGNLQAEANLAIDYLNKALEIDPNRITELYRRANLKAEILTNITLFNKQNDKPIEQKLSASSELLKSAEEDYKRITDIYENSISESSKKIKNKKHYVKALYHLAQINMKFAKINYDPASLLNGELKIYQTSENELIKKTELLNIADQYINKCILEDNNKPQLEELIEAGTTNNFAIGVYKLYLKGMIQFNLYLITNKTKHNLLAKECLYKANETNFPKEMQKQNKLFIIEKIAQMKIAENKFQDAITLLEPHYKQKRFFPEFAAYTLTIAYILSNKLNQASEIITEQLQNQNSTLHKKFMKLQEIYFNNMPQEKIKLLYKEINSN